MNVDNKKDLKYKEQLDNWFAAAEEGDVETLRSTLNNGYDIETTDPQDSDQTAFMTSVKFNRWETADFLMDSGANVDAKDKYGTSALMYAVRKAPFSI